MATHKRHPNFLNPPIVEAVCDIRFDSDPQDDWTPGKAGQFIQEAHKRYPSVEATTGLELNVQQGGGVIQQTISPGAPRFKLTHKSDPLMIQMGSGRISISAVEPYKGWDFLLSEVRRAWGDVIKLFSPTSITRIGVRYINRIPLFSKETKPSYWLKGSSYLPRALLNSFPPYSSRIETRTDMYNIVIVTLVHSASGDEGKQDNLIFDIDVIREKTIKPDLDVIIEHIQDLHEREWVIFSESMSKRLENWMNRGG